MQTQHENILVLNKVMPLLSNLQNHRIRAIGDYFGNGETSWLVEGTYEIEPCEYNDNAEIKYDGYTIRKIPRNQFKQYIKDRMEEFINDDNIDYELNNDCLDNRIKNMPPKLSVPKLIKKVWDNERFNFLNDGFFTTKTHVYIIDFNYSTFATGIDTFN